MDYKKCYQNLLNYNYVINGVEEMEEFLLVAA